MRLPAAVREALHLADAPGFSQAASRDARLYERFILNEGKKSAIVDRNLLRAWEEVLRASIASLLGGHVVASRLEGASQSQNS